jgi:hypothetical protein
MSDFGNRDSHLEAIEKLNREVGPNEARPHAGGYLSQDEYATRAYYWAASEHSHEEAEAMILALANCPWAKLPERELGCAGAVTALCELYPDLAPAWKRSYGQLFSRIESGQRRGIADEGWNDFHVSQWFFLRRARKEDGIEIIDKLLDRLAEGGLIGHETRRHLHYWQENCKPFQVALDKAQTARRAKMLVV